MTWRVVRHPLVSDDIFSMARHVFEHSESEQAAERRIVEAEETIAAISANPMSGTRLGGRLSGFMRRQSTRDQRITVIFRPDPAIEQVYIHLIAFGAQDWQDDVSRR